MMDALARATRPRWLFHGPHWWRSLNARWLSVWGRIFFYRDQR